jgi:uncharacterized membrane protein (GlpM family)
MSGKVMGKVKKIVEGFVILILVIIVVTVSIIAISIIGYKMDVETLNIATAVGGMSTLIVQTACVILLYFTLKEQMRNNDALIEKNNNDIKLNEKRIDAIELHIKSQRYNLLKKNFNNLIFSFQDMIEKPGMLSNYRAWRFYLCKLRHYLEDVKIENITQGEKRLLNKGVKELIDHDFNEGVYNKIEGPLKEKHNLTQPYSEIRNLLREQSL